jgi:ribonuclease BN
LILGAVFNATYQELRQGELKSRRGDVITIIQSFSGDGSDSKKHKKDEDDS